MTKLATIEKIHSVQAHFNADKLEVAKIKEWPVVVKKGEYKDGDLVVFIQIDSIVPFTNPYFAFMEKQHYRVWNAKFRGAPSQGLVCPLSILPNYMRATGAYPYDVPSFGCPTDVTRVVEGIDVTELLGVTKYEKGLDTALCGDAKGGFPTHLIPITDEENLLNYPECLKEFVGDTCYLTVKADGSSMTVIYNDGQVSVCSRRLEQKEGTGFWKLAEKYDLPNKLKSFGHNIAIQAEACGGKIQGNPLGLTEQSIFVFNIKCLDTGKWCGWDEIFTISLALGLPTVQLVKEQFVFGEDETVANLQQIANTVTYTTATGEKRKGEGMVLRPTRVRWSVILGKNLSVKILNQDY